MVVIENLSMIIFIKCNQSNLFFDRILLNYRSRTWLCAGMGFEKCLPGTAAG
jgi:hypothetical protein